MSERTEKVNALIVDDEHANELAGAFLAVDSVVKAGSLSEAVEALKKNPDVVVLDVMFPKNPGDAGHGFRAGLFLDELEKHCRGKGISPPPVFLVSGQSEPAKNFNLVEQWLDEGRILDVLPKSLGDIGWNFFRAVLRRKIADCFARLQAEARTRSLEKQTQELRVRLRIENKLIGDSPAIRNIERQIAQVAPQMTTVLIRGESGVGKELVACAVHDSSPRKDKPLVTLNCAALPEQLLESELFGHEKGAFTGADRQRIGKFELANGGTIFLDEIGEMALPTQAKFLRVLEGHPFERVGGNQQIKVDVRVVAATNKALEQAIEARTFREDLFYRLNVFEITVPPLRDRKDDVSALTKHFLGQFVQRMGRKIDGFTPAAMKKMARCNWRGNVRELRNVVERAVVVCTNRVIDASDITLITQTVSLPPSDSENNSEFPDDYLAELKGDAEMWKELTEDYKTPVMGSVKRQLGDSGRSQLEALDAALAKQTNPDPFHYYKAILFFCLFSPHRALKLDELSSVLPLSKPQATKVLKGLAGENDKSMGACYVMSNPILSMTRDGAGLEFSLQPGLV